MRRLRELLIEALEWFDVKPLTGEHLIDRMQKFQGNRPKVVQR